VSEWQPIETAPNTGAFLVTDGAYVAEVFSKRRGDGFSQTTDGYIFSDATHWMPCPELPTDKTKADQSETEGQPK